MKTAICAALGLMILTAPAVGLAQKTSTLPVEQAEGYQESNRLNDAIVTRNNQAAAQEAAAQAQFRAGVAAAEQANRDEKARYDAAVKADADMAARDKAAYDAEMARFNAQVAAEQAANAAKDRAYQEELARAKAVNDAYEKDLADYNACIAGDKKRCKPTPAQ